MLAATSRSCRPHKGAYLHFRKGVRNYRDRTLQNNKYYFLVGGLSSYERGDFLGAIDDLEQTFASGVWDGAGLVALARSYAERGRLRKAVDACQHASRLGVEDQLAGLCRGWEARATPAALGFTLQNRLAAAEKFDQFSWFGRRKQKPLLKALIKDLGDPPAGTERAHLLAETLTTLAVLYWRGYDQAQAYHTLKISKYYGTSQQRSLCDGLVYRWSGGPLREYDY